MVKKLENKYIAFVACLSLALVCCTKTKPTAEYGQDASRWIEKENELFQRGAYDSALVCLDIADSLAFGNDSMMAYTAGERVVLLANMGRLDEARRCLPQALSRTERINDDESLSILYSSAGVICRRLGMNDSALAYFKRGVEVAKKIDAKDCVANLFNNIGVIFGQQDRFSEGLSYTRLAEKWAKAANDSNELHSALGNRAGILMRQNKYKEARAVLEPTFEEIIAHGYTPNILKCANPLLTAYIELGMTDKAQRLIDRMKPYVRNTGATSIAGRGILEASAKLYHKRGEYRRELATLNLMDSLNMLNQSVKPQELLYQKAECFAKLGDTAEAMKLMRRAYFVGDSLKNTDTNRQMSEFSVKYKTQEKELELAREKERRTEQRVHLLTVIALLIAACAALVFIVMRARYRRKAASHAYELAIKRRFIEGMEDERARLARELHDGTCNELLELSMKMNAEGSACLPMVRNIRDSVRRISHELMPPRLSSLSINDVVSDYLSHYPIDGCTVEFSSSDNTDWRSVPENVAYEVYRIVQEGMGNIVKHAHPTTVKVALGIDNTTLRLTIENDGVETNDTATSDGIGTRTLNDRVASVGGTAHTTVGGGTYHTEVAVPLATPDKKVVKSL